MKAHQKTLTRIMTLIVGLTLCGMPEFVQALPQQTTSPQASPQDQQSGTSVDPSKGPLQPVPAQNEAQPEAPAAPNPEATTEALPATPAPQPKPEQQMQQPLGTATAEGVPTVGGAASRPAGEAMAPAKQKQRRSLLIKMGLIAAVGVAGGTVYALSKGTSSKP